MNTSRMGRISSGLAIVCATLAISFQVSNAQVITLVDNNSLAQVNVGSQAGMFNWSVQGMDQLISQWFWYRVAQSPEASIDTISPAAVTLFNGTRGLSTYYANNQFGIRVDYLLSGGPVQPPGQSAFSDIAETITIYNLSGAPLDFHFFQYSDFDLAGTRSNDSVQLGRNIRGLFNEALQVDGAGGALTETVTTTGANHGEAALFASTLVKLNDASWSNLSDVGGPIGPGDATWALQWDMVIDPGSYALISKDKYLTVVIPEPSSMALIGLGLLGFGLFRNRRDS